MITLKEITTKKEMKTFVKFPFEIYKDHAYWVPPIINDEVDSFDKTINPVFKHAIAHFYLAYRNNKIVGRVAAIINWTEVNHQKIKKMRFGWFDFIDDIEVSKALLAKVEEIGQQHQLEFMEGPVGFSNLDKVGVMITGFDHIGTMITWYNHPYYKDHLEQLGFEKAKEWQESYIYMKDVDPENFQRLAKIIKDRNQLKVLNFTSTKQLLPYVKPMFDLFNISYASLASFVPISDIEIDYFKKKYIGLIDPELIKYIVDKEGNLVAFSIAMPSFSEALQKAKGKLFPFGIFHLLKARKTSKEVVLYLIGIHPNYQNKGLPAIIFDESFKVCNKRGITKFLRTPELEENNAIHLIFKNFNPTIYKRRRTYRKNL
jgi:ribosomal protein S18 acetylase RimI-like enzyme